MCPPLHPLPREITMCNPELTPPLIVRFELIEREIDRCQDEFELIDLIDEWESISRDLSDDDLDESF